MIPVVKKNFFDSKMLGLLKVQCDLLKNSNIEVDNNEFFRKFVHNHPLLRVLHGNMVEEASEIFGEKVKPSYVFLSMYFKGQGAVPLHIDRPQCYRTIDVCLNQEKVWPIYVNHTDKWSEDKEEQEKIKNNAGEYLLQPGDAVCYSGTDHPHFRRPMKELEEQKDNFCDLAFFHFVPENFEGSLH